MKKFYESVQLEIKELVIYDLTNNGTSVPGFIEGPDDGNMEVG